MTVAMNHDIPGFYFDKEKNRYFKIKPGTAYNADNVKKRKAEQDQAERVRKRQERLQNHIKRASILADPLTGGRLAREFGCLDRELPVETWTRGLRAKGAVPFSTDPDAPSIPCMLVNGDDQHSGMGVVYAATDNQTRITGCYIATDEEERISFSADPLMRRSRLYELRQEHIICNNLTSIDYHKASHKILLTGSSPGAHQRSGGARQASVILFSPPLSSDHAGHPHANEPGPHPSWLLGENHTQMILTHPNPALAIRTARLAPSSHGGSGLTALLATSDGLLRLTDGDRPLEAILPPEQTTRNVPKPPLHDVLAVDWHPANPAVVFAGARDGKFFRVDTRAGADHWGRGGWEWFRHRSSVAHLRAIGDHQLLATGPRGAMAVYDQRWLEGGRRRGKEARPVVRMNGYANAARLDLGLDIATVGGGMGEVVAAGLDDGTIGIFSLRTGKKLRAGAVDDPATMKLTDGAVVKCLQWEKMPWERDLSLWVGAGSEVRKFSFGLDEGEDEDY